MSGLASLEDFEIAEKSPYSVDSLRSAVAFIHSKKLHLDDKMVSLLSLSMPEAEEIDTDLGNLVHQQLRSAIALKNSYFNPTTGKLLDGVNAREAKDALSSVQQVIGVLIKQQDELDRQSRLVSMENILIRCMDDLPEECKDIKERFLDQVSRQLGELS